MGYHILKVTAGESASAWDIRFTYFNTRLMQYRKNVPRISFDTREEAEEFMAEHGLESNELETVTAMDLKEQCQVYRKPTGEVVIERLEEPTIGEELQNISQQLVTDVNEAFREALRETILNIKDNISISVEPKKKVTKKKKTKKKVEKVEEVEPKKPIREMMVVKPVK